MSNLYIIPARGGSTRFPNKNIAKLNGQPLIYHTLDTITQFIHNDDTIIFTSDSDDILKIAKEHKMSSRILYNKRPDHLATNTSKVIDTISHYFDELDGVKYSRIWQLLPTCPLRNTHDLECAMDLLTSTYDSVISITEYEFPPQLALKHDPYNGLIGDYDDYKPWQSGNTRSQDFNTLYRPNGAVYVMWSSKFAEYRNFYKGNVKGYIMPRSRSIDIDTELDLKIAGILK